MDLAAAGKYYAFQKSFQNSVKCLLTVCSREVVKDAFPSFADEERERLYRMLTNLMRSMHANIEVAIDLDKTEDFAEEHNLDWTSIDAIEEEVSRMKKNEIEYLAASLKKVEESNKAMKARIELLKKEEDLTEAGDHVHKMTQWNSTCLNNSDI